MFKREAITSFGEIRLRLSGMRVTEVYETLCQGEEAQISHYWLRYEDHEDKYDLQRSVTVPADEMIAVLDRCGVIGWDGFRGKNPPGLLDGTMFDFTATVNGRRIHADGSNNFPRHYRDLTDALYAMLNAQEADT